MVCPELRDLTIIGGIRELSPLAGLRELRSLSIDAIATQGTGLSALEHLPLFEHLSVSYPDAIFLQRLEESSVRGIRLDLRHNTKLRAEEIWSPLARVAGFKALQIEGDIPVDSASLRHIAGMRGLRSIVVGRETTNRTAFRDFSAADVADLRAARPDMEVVVDAQP